MIRAAVIALVLGVAAPASAQVDYRFPGADDHRQYFYITAYRDLSGSGNGLQDWNCGTKTYDGHNGTDMGVGGFAGMDAGRDIVAAADGVVTYTIDGNFDRCTDGTCAGGGGFGNYVRVEHADGKVTYYGHMKMGSVAVTTGQTVTCGQKLGEVGSSGHSTGPHLHFEPRINGVGDDPFTGPCGGPLTYWVDQGAYLGLPEPICQNQPAQHPSLSMDAALDVTDLQPGETAVASFYVADDAAAFKSPDVVVGVEALGGYVDIVDWQVLDNYAGNECGGDYCPNDANDNPDNPAHASPGNAFDLHLNAVSPGETKRVDLTLAYVAPTNGAEPHARVRLWVKQVEGSYAKADFDAAPDNVDGSQTWNEGDLRHEVVLDTWDGSVDPDGPGGPSDPADPSDPGDSGNVDGGCSTGGGGSAGVLVLALGVLGYRRRKHS